jgi:DNA-binding CsgD family transcriptional regulator/tetratricopeptide (TPR) repeat protein
MDRSAEKVEMVGRAAEVARLDSLLAAVAGGVGRTVLVAGDAGIGKTRLVTALAQRARRAGAVVLVGRCLDLVGAAIPFLAFADAFHRVSDSPIRTVAAGAADEPAGRLRLFQQVRDTVSRMAQSAPLVLVLEDIHWADASTLDLVSFLAHTAGEDRLLLVLTYRHDQAPVAGELPRLLGELRSSEVAELLELRPLSQDEIGALLRGLGAATWAEEIFIRSGGNPFFAQELALARERGQPELPPLVRAALTQRLAGLGDDTRACLHLAAVARREVGYDLLDTALSLPPQRLQRALREAVTRHLLVADAGAGTYRFRHALLAEAVSETLLPGQREGLHARLAEAIEATSRGGAVEAGELAYHWRAAGRPVEAFDASVRAAEAAEAAYGLAEALIHWEHIIAVWERLPDAERRAGQPLARVLARAAEHADDIGRGQRAAELTRLAIGLLVLDERTEPVEIALLYERLGSYLLPFGEREAGLAACQRAVELVPAGRPERIRVLSAWGHALMLSCRYDAARTLCLQAIDAAAALGEPRRAQRAQDVLGLSLCYLGRIDEGLAMLEEACRRQPDRAAPERLMRPQVFLSDALLVIGRPQDAARVAFEGLAYTRSVGQERAAGTVLAANAAEALLAVGDWDRAAETLAAALRRGGQYWSHVLHLAAAQLASARAEVETARRHLAAAAPAAAEPNAAAYLACVSAEAALWEGRPADASAMVAEGLASTETSGVHHLDGRLCALGLRSEVELVHAAALTRDAGTGAAARDRATALLERTGRAAALVGYVSAATDAWLALAAAEHARIAGAAPDLWCAAQTAWDALDRPYEVAYCAFRHAEALVAAGAPASAANEPARTADSIAERLGARALRREVQVLARRARLNLARPAVNSDPLPGMGLTPRETAVLRLVALGYTNREIATSLGMSVKTASVHVTNILRKLDVPHRAAAGAVGHRLGLAPTGETDPG